MILFCGIVTAGAFALDVFGPAGMAAALLYVVPVLAARVAGLRGVSFLLAAIATGLTVLGLIIAGDGAVGIATLNRVMAVAIIWLTAWLGLHRNRLVPRGEEAIVERARVEEAMADEWAKRRQAEVATSGVRDWGYQYFMGTDRISAFLSPDGRIDMVNPAFQRLAAKTIDEPAGHLIWQLPIWPPESADKLRRMVEDAASGVPHHAASLAVAMHDDIQYLEMSILPAPMNADTVALLILEAQEARP